MTNDVPYHNLKWTRRPQAMKMTEIPELVPILKSVMDFVRNKH